LSQDSQEKPVFGGKTKLAQGRQIPKLDPARFGFYWRHASFQRVGGTGRVKYMYPIRVCHVNTSNVKSKSISIPTHSFPEINLKLNNRSGNP